MSETQTVECCEHGKGYATYVCCHLINGQNRHWHSAAPNVENQWPDSWCSVCNQFFEVEGEWNEASEQAADLSSNIKIVCHHCYEHIRSNCTTHSI
jgi:hypothetical protein